MTVDWSAERRNIVEETCLSGFKASRLRDRVGEIPSAPTYSPAPWPPCPGAHPHPPSARPPTHPSRRTASDDSPSSRGMARPSPRSRPGVGAGLAPFRATSPGRCPRDRWGLALRLRRRPSWLPSCDEPPEWWARPSCSGHSCRHGSRGGLLFSASSSDVASVARHPRHGGLGLRVRACAVASVAVVVCFDCLPRVTIAPVARADARARPRSRGTTTEVWLSRQANTRLPRKESAPPRFGGRAAQVGGRWSPKGAKSKQGRPRGNQRPQPRGKRGGGTMVPWRRQVARGSGHGGRERQGPRMRQDRRPRVGGGRPRGQARRGLATRKSDRRRASRRRATRKAEAGWTFGATLASAA